TSALAAGNDVVGGRAPKISINGARPEQNSFLLDGTDINNVYNKTPGSVAGVLLRADAVLEFQALTNAYSAEFGKPAGRILTGLTAVPDDNARRGLLPAGPIQLHPTIPRYLDVLFPHANGRSLGGGAAEYQFTLTQPTDEHFAQMRIDHHFASGDTLFGRYTI